MKYTKELANEICERLSDGESLARICTELDVGKSTVRQWDTENYKGFSAQYASAREAQGDYFASKVITVADQILDETYTPDRGRVAIDAYKWTAGKLNGKYSDRLVTENTNINLNQDVDEIPTSELLKIATRDSKKPKK